MASTSPDVGPAASTPGDGSKVVWAASVAGSSAASPGDGSGEMALSAAPGARVRPRYRFIGRRRVGLGRVGRALRRTCGVAVIALAGLQRGASHTNFIFLVQV